MKTSDYSFINNAPAATVIGPMIETRVLRVDDHAPAAVPVGDEETTAGSLVAVVAAKGEEVGGDEETTGSLVAAVAAEGEEVGDEETAGSLVGTGLQQYGAYAAAYLAQKASLNRL